MIGQNYNCERISDKCYLLKSLRFDKRNKHKVKMRSEATMITNNIPLT